MKQTPLKRKTPLKAKSGLKSKTGLNAKSGLSSNSSLKAVSDKKRAQLEAEGKSPFSTLSSNSTLKPVSDKKKANPTKPKRGNSMKGAGRSQKDVHFHGLIVGLGCAACNEENTATPHPLQVHHPDGRNRGSAGDHKEQYALCLCAAHHDTRIYHGFHNGFQWVGIDKSVPSVHSAKKAFYDRYGSEAYLVHEQYVALSLQPVWLSPDEWEHYLSLETRCEKEYWLQDIMGAGNARQRRENTLAKK